MPRLATFVALAAVGLALVVLLIAQLELPGIAEQRLRDRLARHGRVISVSVEAFPAIELLWQDADSVRIHLADYRTGGGDSSLGSLLGQTARVGTLEASADTFTTGLLTLHDASLHKRGDALTGSARVRTADITSALPILTGLTPVASPDGSLVLRGTASLLGVSATIDASVTASDGAILVSPNVPFGGLATVRVFSEPRVAVDSVSGVPTADGFTATASGRLR